MSKRRNSSFFKKILVKDTDTYLKLLRNNQYLRINDIMCVFTNWRQVLEDLVVESPSDIHNLTWIADEEIFFFLINTCEKCTDSEIIIQVF